MALPTLEQLIGAGITEAQFKSALQLLLENIESVEATTLRISNAKNEAITTAASDASTKSTLALVEAKAFSNANKLFKRVLYNSTPVDFNTLLANGEYLFRANSAVSNSQNTPTNVWGALEVFDLSNSETNQYIQKFTEGVSGAVWIRYLGAAWSAWLKNPSSADISNLVNASLNDAKAYTNQYLEKDHISGGIYTHEFLDSLNRTVMSIYIDGGLKLVGLDGTVQDEITALKNQKVTDIKDTSLASLRSKKDTFTLDAQLALNMQKIAQVGGGAPAPINSLYQQNYTMNSSWLNTVKFNKPTNKTVINTPYRNNDGVCHPHIIEFYNGFRGYRYLMLLTPYYNTKEEFENPCVYGSNDLVSFELLDGFQQPLADRPTHEFGTAHNSDNVFTHDPRTGELIVVWRETWRNWNNEGEVADAWVMRKTKDGYTWTEKEYLFGPYKKSTGMYTASPAILYDPKQDLWHVYIGTGAGIQHYVKKLLTHTGWELPSNITVPSEFKPWHVDVRYVGNKIVALVHDNTNGQFRFGVSSDFVNFDWASASNYTESGLDMYKATFLPEFSSSNQLAFNVIYSTRYDNADIAKRWELYVTKTNFVDAGVTLL